MTSSGMKRGLATVAVSALAATGLPFLAGTASATPIASTLGDDAVSFYSVQNGGVSAKNDGTNATVSLVAGGGKNVTSVLYQYALAATPTTWVDVPGGLVARNGEGVFAVDWANPPATLAAVRAVPNTGATPDSKVAVVVPDAAANTVELASEGALGVFQAPYTEANHTGDYVGVTGTVSDKTAVTVSDVSHGASTGATGPAGASATATVTDDGKADTPETFDAVLDIDGYPYSPGTEPNQIALNAATDNTDDAEGSTLYVQTIGSIDASPATQEQVDPSKSEIVITVKDTAGKPVAGAQVGLADLDTDGTGPDTDGPDTILGYTDGNGQLVDDKRTTADTFTYFVNTTDNDEYQPGTDFADTATVTTYTAKLSTVDIVNERNRSNFDIDELGDGDDFTIVTLDQKGNPINEDLALADIEYRWVIDPTTAGVDTFTSAWKPAETNASGEFAVPGLTVTSFNGGDLPAGSYTLEARRPNVNGTGLLNATPETFKASESDISYEEGTHANAPVNGTFTVKGNLANPDGALAGREVHLSYTSGGDAGLAPQADQPAGVTITGANTATVVTDGNGDFSVKLKDQPIPSNVTPTAESGTLHAMAYEAKSDATSLQGNLGPDDSGAANDAANAEQDLAIDWIRQPVAKSVEISSQAIVDSFLSPGRPADLDIVVKDANGAELQDFPVEVSVDHGFLSPNAETEGALTPADGASDNGDLYGVWKNLGTSKQISTGDDSEAGIVAAIERDSGFDDDGLVSMTVTVKAGDVTETKTLVFDSESPLNSGGLVMKRMAGSPAGDAKVGDAVRYNLFAKDQFGNLAGDEWVRVFDNTTLADFKTDDQENWANTDFLNDSESVTATASSPVAQTIEARWSTGKNVWTGGDRDDTAQLVTGSDTINWVAGGKQHISALLKLANNAKGNDVAKVDAPSAAKGATVKLYKVRKDGSRKLVATKTANKYGNVKFVVADANKKAATKYQAKVGATARTFADWTPKASIR